MKEEDVFHQVLNQPPPKREAFLDQVCGDDAQLRGRIDNLIRAHANPGSFLRGPAVAVWSPTLSESPVSESPGTVIGPYKLLEQIGEGGFGVVFMAEQTVPVKRNVALKVIKPGMDTKEVIARFEAERQALALMDHPNIARVLDAGTTETGRPFFVMELVCGVPITDYCDRHQLTPRERLELFVAVCQAVQHAHQKGIIHRDIKPTNVLVTQHDDRAVVKVIDFGVAKAMRGQLTDRTLFTGFAQMIGTPMYMSPEQAEMSGLGVDTRTDIYGLGVLLYELLTGTTPFAKESFQSVGYDEIRRIIREQEPAPPSVRISTLGKSTTVLSNRRTELQALFRQCRGELDWIVMKCLEKDRNRRYETAASLAADVRRYLSDEPLQACPPSAMYQFCKFARRNRRTLLTATLVILSVVLTATGSGVLIWQGKQNLQQALESEQRTSYFQRITLAHRDLSTDNLSRALTLLNECPDELRGWEWYYLMRLCRVEPIVLRHNSDVNCVAFSPDGEQLVAACKDGSIKIWSTSTNDIVLDLRDAHTDAVASIAVHPDGTHLASAGVDCIVKVWNVTSGQPVFSAKLDHIHVIGTSQVVAFSPNGQHLAVSRDGSVKVWDWQTHEIVNSLPGNEKRSMSVAFSHDGQLLASGTWQGGLTLYDLEKPGGSPWSLPNRRRHPISGLSFSSDGGRLAAACFDRTVRVWNTATGALIHTLMHPGLNMGVTFSPDDRLLASAGQDRVIHIWDAVTGREVLALRGHRAQCTCLAFSPDGRRLASASQDGTVRLWDATPLKGNETQEITTFTAHNDEVHCLAVGPDGRRVASSDFDSQVKVWDATSGRVSLELPNQDVALHDQVVFWLAWHPDGRRIASAGSTDGLFTVKVWDAGSGRNEFSLPLDSREYPAVAFSPDGRFLVTGRADGTVQAWDAQSGQPASPDGTIGSHPRAPVRGVAFSRDSRHLASAAGDGSVKLWDATRFDQPDQPQYTFSGYVPGISVTIDFSPDGRLLAMGDQDYTVTIRDVESGQPVQTLRGHTGEVHAVAFSPVVADRWIATAGEDSIVRIWDCDTGALIRNFRGHTALVTSLAFSPDGERLYSASRDMTVKVWDMSQLRDADFQVHQGDPASLEAARRAN